MEELSRENSEKRSLASVTDGMVIAVGELGDGVYSKRVPGDGYAVLPSAGIISKGLRLIYGSEIELSAPTDGVVTGIEQGRLTLRTGDGISVCVVMGEDARLFTDVGSRLSAGEHFCTLPDESSLYCGAVPVLFPDPAQVTELHIESGFRRSGDKAAQYKPAR